MAPVTSAMGTCRDALDRSRQRSRDGAVAAAAVVAGLLRVHDAAAIHHERAARRALEHLGAVADDQERRAVLVVESANQPEDLVANGGIEGRRWLVSDDERRPADDGLGDQMR